MIKSVSKLGKVSVGRSYPVRIMGIINTSSESFHKSSIVQNKRALRDIVVQMESDGADIIDVGGMSTAPYKKTLVSEKVESKRVLDAINIIQQATNLPISVDTCRASVAKVALENGVEILNDISGLKYDKLMLNVVHQFHPSLVLCAFSKSQLRGNLIDKTKQLLKSSMNLAKAVGISKNKIVFDPAIGFFRKNGSGNFFTKISSDWFKRDIDTFQNLKSFSVDIPILISSSNKSFIGKILGKTETNKRIYGSVVADALAVIYGASVIRTHNVSQTNDAIKIAQKLGKNLK